MAKKWVAYGATGVVGLAVLGGGAAVAAGALDLRTTDGQIIDVATPTGDGSSSAIVGGKNVTAEMSPPTPGEKPSIATPNSIAGPSPFSVVTPGETASDSTPDGAPVRLPAPDAQTAASASDET